MTLLDAYALVALLADEPAAVDVDALLRGGGCRMTPANLVETIDVSRRIHRIPADDVRDALEPLFLSGAVAMAVSDEERAWGAADLRARYYHRQRCRLSLADCILLAHAVCDDDSLATSDPDVARTARLEDVRVIPLPDRDGRQP